MTEFMPQVCLSTFQGLVLDTSMREHLADAVFNRSPKQHLKKFERIITEIQKSVVPIRPDDGSTPRYLNPKKILASS